MPKNNSLTDQEIEVLRGIIAFGAGLAEIIGPTIERISKLYGTLPPSIKHELARRDYDESTSKGSNIVTPPQNWWHAVDITDTDFEMLHAGCDWRDEDPMRCPIFTELHAVFFNNDMKRPSTMPAGRWEGVVDSTGKVRFIQKTDTAVKP